MYVFLLFFAFTTNNIHENCEYSSISICNVKQRSSYDNTRSFYATGCNKALRNWMKGIYDLQHYYYDRYDSLCLIHKIQKRKMNLLL